MPWLSLNLRPRPRLADDTRNTGITSHLSATVGNCYKNNKNGLMDRDQLIDLTRRAVKLARDKTTDLTPTEHIVAADTYTSPQRHAQDTAMLMASPQLVGYASELPGPGTYCTKTVMGRSVLLTRSADNIVRAFDNVCLHRQSRIT